MGAAPNSSSAERLCHTWVLGKDPQSHGLGSAGTSILQVQHHTVCQHHLSSHPEHVEEMRCCSWSRMVSAPLHPGSILGLSITHSSPSSKAPCCQSQIYKGPLVYSALLPFSYLLTPTDLEKKYKTWSEKTLSFGIWVLYI